MPRVRGAARRADCQAASDALGAASWGAGARGAVHPLLVDAYCLQHPDDYCRSATSYAAHSTGLCCGVERGGDPGLYRAIARWLDGPRALHTPAVRPACGAATVADVVAAPDNGLYGAGVRAWAQAVWAACALQHALARAWLDEAARGQGR